MFEFETHGGVEVLEKLEEKLITCLGIARKDEIKKDKYLNIAKKYGTKFIEHEEMIYKEYGNAFLLTDFPRYTSPFWNMEMEDGIAKKIDVILCGQETIGGAERATDVNKMYELFNTISDGEYAGLLYEKFGKDRVNRELDDYFSLKFFERCGAGIGITRLIRALELSKVI